MPRMASSSRRHRLDGVQPLGRRAGGVPTVESILVTAFSPHTLAIRPLVLPADTELRVHTDDGPDELLVTVDGQVGTTFAVATTSRPAGGSTRADRSIPGSTFFPCSRAKLGWGGLADRDQTA
jgi:NAD+ kinase